MIHNSSIFKIAIWVHFNGKLFSNGQPNAIWNGHTSGYRLWQQRIKLFEVRQQLSTPEGGLC